MGEPEETTRLGSPNGRLAYNIKMNLKDLGCETVDCIYLAQNKDKWWAGVNTVMNLRVP